MRMKLNNNVWLPKLEFILQTVAVTYPKKPNTVTKKKYYEFIQNLPIFIPIYPFGNNFIKLLDKYPVTPYLDSRESFMRWTHYIFNKIDKQMEKPEKTFYESLEKYYEEYKPKEMKKEEQRKLKEKYYYFVVGLIVIFSIYYNYKK
jgi:hypothetical protein|tara:strand:+ start:545 stop:982 length:438 start_codon:yes stop_codon:yes gene_type:complete